MHGSTVTYRSVERRIDCGCVWRRDVNAMNSQWRVPFANMRLSSLDFLLLERSKRIEYITYI